MSELLGADLDAAVARALKIEGLVYRPNGQPAYEFEWDPEARCHEDKIKEWKMWRWYNPSVDQTLAMDLQIAHDIAIYPDALAPRVGTEKWVAGFDLRATVTEEGHSTGGGTWIDGEAGIELDHAARGDTPQIAICRAIVVRHAAAAEQEKAAIIAKAQAAIKQAAEEHLQQLRAVAWDRAQVARRTRVPFTDFANDEERVAYAEAMDQQLTVVQQRNPDLYGGKA